MAILVRAGIAAFAALTAWWGAWARLAPRSFFDMFPGWGHHWTAAYPPYNEHLVTDLGATFLTLSFLLVVAAVLDDRRVRRVVLAAVLLFDALHLSFHAADPGTLGGLDAVASVAALAVGVVGPMALLVLDAVAAHATQDSLPSGSAIVTQDDPPSRSTGHSS